MMYASVFGTKTTPVVKETTQTLTTAIDEVERLHPNSTVVVLGDFNSVSLNLSRYTQHINTTTRHGKILDKAYTNNKAVYKCYNLGPLRASDHDMVYLIPRNLKHSQESSASTRNIKLWNEPNIERLTDCLD